MRRWKCTGVDSNINNLNKKRWTENKIYETDKNGCGLVSDDGDNGFVNVVNFTMKIQGVEFVEVTQFTKADLKPCMVVELRNKWIARIEEVKGGLCVSVVNKETDWSELCYYNEDLTCAWARYKSWDIMKVYGFCDYGCGKYLLNTENRKLLWERIEKSPTQLKLEELENKQREIADEIRKISEEM